MKSSKSLKTYESGRSMVEMLGVLAIVGVLSVMGIAGYTQAMKSYRANEICSAASMLYIMGTTRSAGEDTRDLAYEQVLGDLSNLSNVSAMNYVGNNKTISMTITDEDVCNKVVNTFGDKVTSGTCSGNSSQLTVTLGDTNDGQSDTPTCTLAASDCLSGSLIEGECECAPADYYTECSSFTKNECGRGLYCDFESSNASPYSDAQGHPLSGENGDIVFGECEPIAGELEMSHGHYLSSFAYSWYTCNSLCISKGRSGIIGFSGLNEIAGSNDIIKEGYSCENENGCCSTDDSNCGKAYLTAILGDLGVLWTNHLNNSVASVVYLGADAPERVYTGVPKNTTGLALCLCE